MSVGSRYTNAEAYGANNEQLDVALSFGDEQSANAGFELYQNTPNPFVGETQIIFSLSEPGEVLLSVHDVTGRVHRLIKSDYSAGKHQILLKDLPKGVMYYTLQSGDFTATKKMIHID
jgi:hypothetical protein